MNQADISRELTKIKDALTAAETYLMHQNEGNALAHMNDKVLYWPLTQAVMTARESAQRLLEHSEGPAVDPEETAMGTRNRLLAQVLSHLDRCDHGRHEGDGCFDCPEAISPGNPRLPVGQRIGTALHGQPIYMPLRGLRYRPEEWYQQPAENGDTDE